MKSKFKRVLLKLSGEILGGGGFGLNPDSLEELSREIHKVVTDLGVEMGIVVGGGNIIRGKNLEKVGFDRITADYMGMLATAINAMALQTSLEKLGLEVRILSAIEIKEVGEPFVRKRAIHHLSAGRVVIFACGTGNPLFTTDTAAALKASEIGAEVLLKGTKVDGVYDKDPQIYEDAKKFDYLDLDTMFKLDLKVMDQTAIALCRENHIPVIVFNITVPGNLYRVLKGENVGTFVEI